MAPGRRRPPVRRPRPRSRNRSRSRPRRGKPRRRRRRPVPPSTTRSSPATPSARSRRSRERPWPSSSGSIRGLAPPHSSSASGSESANVPRVRRLLPALAAALVVAPAAQAGPQPGSVGPIEARAYYVENAATGEVLAARNPDARVPIASITKLMTVLVTLEHAKLSDVVTVPPGAAVVGESTIHVRAGERLTVRDLIRAALIQSANDAAYALALHVGRGDLGRFVAMMNAKAAGLRLRDTHFVRPDGLDAPGHVSSARDVTRLAWIAMRNPFVRATVREQTATIGGGRTLHTWNDLLSTFPHLLGVKTGHTNGAGWSEVAAARGRGTTVYATILGS